MKAMLSFFLTVVCNTCGETVIVSDKCPHCGADLVRKG